ncbi:unnamed protein product [Lymnaea stagnalis]|uniref:U11/U12 small nuclear ribonucleoprotein 35 kDa protein n=1 Tax=Lymnaea stagnalis TaxID=6523 RepID=A0AAV2IJL1_LYMST
MSNTESMTMSREMRNMESYSPVFVDAYNPLQAGSIDGTDEYPHDKAISRAMISTYKPNKFVIGDPECTVFVGHLSPLTTDEIIIRSMKQYGTVVRARVVKDIVTGFSKCYAFVEFTEPYEARNAVRSGNKTTIDDHEVLMEMEKERTLRGWIPRRLGGGLGGKRESGQLRFGGKDRPFRKPILRANVENIVSDNMVNYKDKPRFESYKNQDKWKRESYRDSYY